MSDDFLDGFIARARANWRESDEAVEQLADRLKRQMLWSRLAFPAELGAAAVAVTAGVWFMVWPIAGYEALTRIAGAVLLVAIPILTTASWFARRAQPQWDSETPESVLRFALRKAAVTESLLRLAGWHAYVLVGFVAMLWVAAFAGYVARDAFLFGFTAFYLAIATFAYFWARRRAARLVRERERCKQLLAEFFSEP